MPEYFIFVSSRHNKTSARPSPRPNEQLLKLCFFSLLAFPPLELFSIDIPKLWKAVELPPSPGVGSRAPVEQCNAITPPTVV